jgi:GxxExxY protein
MQRSKAEIEQIASVVVDACITVHRQLGPGLMESTYQVCLAHELRTRQLEVQCELSLPVRYGEIAIDAGYRLDMLVGDCILVENKSVQAILPIHEAQILTDLKPSGHRPGFLLNWNVPLMRDGTKRMVNRF